MSTVAQIGRKYELLKPLLNERQRRLWAAAEALAIGHGGMRRVVEATGLDVRTLRTGIDPVRLRITQNASSCVEARCARHAIRQKDVRSRKQARGALRSLLNNVEKAIQTSTATRQ